MRGADVVLGGDVEGVEVSGGGCGQAWGGLGLVAQESGGGGGGVVAGEDAFQEVGGGGRVDVLGADDVVRVAVADDGDVDVVGDGAAGEHRVELLAGLGPGGQGVRGVDGDALGAVHGAGVAELGGGGDVGGGEGDVPVGAGVLGDQGPVRAGVQDGPAVAVLDPVVRAEAQAPVVGAGGDPLPGVRGVAVCEAHPWAGRGAGEAVGLGALVELGDKLSGGCEHDRVGALGAVLRPGGEEVLGGGGEVADVDAVLVEVEPEGLDLPVPQGQGGGGFGGVDEPDQLGQVQRPVGGGDVA